MPGKPIVHPLVDLLSDPPEQMPSEWLKDLLQDLLEENPSDVFQFEPFPLPPAPEAFHAIHAAPSGLSGNAIEAFFGNGPANDGVIQLDFGGFDAKPSSPGGGKGGGGSDGGGGGGGGKGGGKPDKGGDSGGGTTDPGTVLDSYTSGGDAATAYNITVEFMGTWTEGLQSAFIDAADYLSSIILADLPDEIYNGQYFDDLTISATLTDIDGSGGILGQAGPTLARDGTYLPLAGIMEFDIADAETFDGYGLWDDIVLHEMVHTMGFGTLWSYMGLTSGSVATGDMRFTGEIATALYNSEFADIANADPDSANGVPVETDGGAGTAGGHWDETIFTNEIMTGYINNSNYISEMSIAALEDMGYDTVIDDPNDPFDLYGTIPVDPLSDAIV
ncbi:leishmanolysin-related zinc metalloendopeptidase [Marimonas lutisalis]|uniref:leishmanolysin-related zinc metalloendopeptidase n=1 Tax=Marimonas lutisalis TaxID=2545756 RepID=UPI0010F5F690|nr:leishmanolysin-related zinc metalloendopeptidase [Marimonas lutisalis]